MTAAEGPQQPDEGDGTFETVRLALEDAQLVTCGECGWHIGGECSCPEPRPLAPGEPDDESVRMSQMPRPRRPRLTDDQVLALLGLPVDVTQETRFQLHELMVNLDSIGPRNAFTPAPSHLDRAGRSLGSALLLIDDLGRLLGADTRGAVEMPWDARPVLHRALLTIYSLAHDAEKRLADATRQAAAAAGRTVALEDANRVLAEDRRAHARTMARLSNVLHELEDIEATTATSGNDGIVLADLLNRIRRAADPIPNPTEES